MFHYIILQNPGHNRVYFKASEKLAMAELALAAPLLSREITDIAQEEICGVKYIGFESEAALGEADFSLLSALSFTYAIFLVKENGEDKYLIPILKESSYYFDSDINTILRYAGKTNELFTKFMVNAAAFLYRTSGGIPQRTEQLTLLDPVCGRGTTLFEALSLGIHARGIDIDEKSIHELDIYFKKYLETNKFKHTRHQERITIEKHKCEQITYEFARNKADEKTQKQLSLRITTGSAKHTDLFFKKNSVHLIVGDLPYGIAHANKANAASGSRSPAEFLNLCLPALMKVLVPGGVLAFAWNNFVLKRADMEEILLANGFDLPATADFSHRVDQAINRDFILAIKPIVSF